MVERGLRWFVVLVAVASLGSSCSEELIPEEPEGAYLLWRKALLSGDTEGVYAYLDGSTHTLLDKRVQVLERMNEDIARYLPQVDQKLARNQTGVVLLEKHEIENGGGLFGVIFQPTKLEVTPEIEVGTLISSVEYNEAGDEAAIISDAGQEFRLKKESDGVWRITSWKGLCEDRTQWILDNQTALEQTVQDLINEEQEEIDAVIKFLLNKEKARAAAQGSE